MMEVTNNLTRIKMLNKYKDPLNIMYSFGVIYYVNVLICRDCFTSLKILLMLTVSFQFSNFQSPQT